MEMAGKEGDRTTRPPEIRCSKVNPLNSQVHGGSSDSFPLPSQPFDLRNWFSSYEYESPGCSGLPDYLGSYLLPGEEGEIDTQEHVLESCFDAKFTGLVEDEETDTQYHALENSPDAKFIGLIEEGEIDTQEHVFESCPHAKFIGLVEEVGEIDTLEHPLDSSVNAKVIASVEEGEIDSQEHPLESSLDAKVIDSVVEHEGKHSAKYDNVGDCEINCEISRTSGNLLMDEKQSSIRLPSLNDLKVQIKIPSLIFDEEVPGLRLEIKQDGLHSTRAGKDTMRISTNVAVESVSVDDCDSCEHNSKCKESIYLKPKVADEITEDMVVNANVGTNGFISTKNNRNSWTDGGAFHSKLASTMNCKSYEKETRAKTLQDNDQTKLGKRNALMDKTNVFEGEANTVPEIPGKWQCPRKNKPYMGPPLKQLRMEQWLHRVNKDHSNR